MGKLIYLAFIVLFLSSCNNKFTYQIAETAMIWKIDDYFDLSAQQRKIILTEFNKTNKEVVAEELVEFKALIKEANYIEASCNQIEDSYKKIQKLTDRVLVKYQNLGANLIEQANADQIKYFIKEVEDKIADEANDKTDLSERKNNQLKRYKSNFEQFFGDLSKEQTTEIELFLNDLPAIRDDLFETRAKNLSEFKKVSDNLEASKAYLKKYLTNWKSLQDTKFLTKFEDRQNKQNIFFTKFACEASQKQKKHLLDKTNDYIDSIENIFK